MGSRFSPICANLFMGKVEQDHVHSNNTYFYLLKSLNRFIHYLFVFFIFTGTTEELEAFKEYLNFLALRMSLTDKLMTCVSNLLFLEMCLFLRKGL